MQGGRIALHWRAALLCAATAISQQIDAQPILASGAFLDPTETYYANDFAGSDSFTKIYETVGYDADAGPWAKNLTISGADVLENQMAIAETIFVEGDTAISGWREESAIPDWTWVYARAYAYDEAGDLLFDIFGELSAYNVSFLFPTPVPVGGNIGIIKQILYMNGEVATIPNGTTIRIYEYPTIPEPGTLALLGLGLAGLGAVRRKKLAA